MDFRGRFLLGRVVVLCPRGSTPCTVTVNQLDHGRLRLLPLAFAIPPGRASKIRLRLTERSLHRLIRARRGHAAVLVTARQGAGPQARKRVAIRLLAPRHKAHVRHRLRGRALKGRPLAEATGPARATVGLRVGISEQGTLMFSDLRFRALAITTARVVVPWNAAWTDAGRVGDWLQAATAAGVEPFVTFDHDIGAGCPSACTLPSVSAYEAAVRAFLAEYPQVHVVAPWNEPNHAAEPTAGRPDRAAEYYNAARRACPACTLVAGDVIDGPGMVAWLARYRTGLAETPAVWGLHDYYDTTYFRTSGLADFTHAVTGQVWLTETGGIVGLRTRDGEVSLPRDELRARASVAFAFEEARAFSGRVARMYLYQWRADPQGRFDAGLERADGSARPAMDVVREQISAPGASAPAKGVPTSAVPGATTIAASGAGAVRVRCAGRTRCVGTLWIEDRRLATVTLVNGHLPGDVLRTRALRYLLAPGRAARLDFTVPRSVLVPAWGRRELRVRLALASPAQPFALAGRYRVDAWRPATVTRRPRRAR